MTEEKKNAAENETQDPEQAGEKRPAEDIPAENELPDTEKPETEPAEPGTEEGADESAAEADPDAGTGPKGRRGEIKKLKKELEEARKALGEEKKHTAEAEERILRIAAEYDNFRKRTQSERAGIYANAVSDTLAGLLPVIDNLQYAAKYSGGDAEKMAEGLNMILSKLPETLDKIVRRAGGHVRSVAPQRGHARGGRGTRRGRDRGSAPAGVHVRGQGAPLRHGQDRELTGPARVRHSIC